jgi:hypothetical protein
MVLRFRIANEIELLYTETQSTTDRIHGPRHAMQSWSYNFLEFAALFRKAYFLRTHALTAATTVRDAGNGKVDSRIHIGLCCSLQKRMMRVLLLCLLCQLQHLLSNQVLGNVSINDR